MSDTLTPAGPVTQGSAEFAGILTQLLRRYAADVPAGQQNEVDRAVARALDQLPDARRVARRMAKRIQDLPAADRGVLVTPQFAAAPLTRTVEVDAVRAALRKFPPGDAATPASTSTHRYELRFSHLVCRDETNPEIFGSDEVYVVFGWITQDMAEQGFPARAVSTPVYGDIDDGDRRPGSGSQNLRLFGPRKVGEGLVLTATCFEHDLGDTAETLADVSTALTAAAAAATLIGGITAAAVALGAAVTKFLSGIGADDQIGDTVTLRLTQRSADTRTASSPSVMLPFLEHEQGDGHYRTFLQLRRI